ncbi:MAG: PilZ domain-containing protein [Sphingobium sp.]
MGAERLYQHDRSTRMAERSHVVISVRVRRPGESWYKSRIADLSVTGFRLQSFMKLQPGSDLWIMLPGFEGRRAHVQWTRGHEAGCTFERPLHPAIFEHIVRSSERRAEA